MKHRILFALVLMLAACGFAPASAADSATIPASQSALVDQVVAKLAAQAVHKADSLAHDSVVVAAKDSAKAANQATETRKAAAEGTAAGGLFSGLLVAFVSLWHKAKVLPGQVYRIVKTALNDPTVQTVGIDAAEKLAKIAAKSVLPPNLAEACAIGTSTAGAV